VCRGAARGVVTAVPACGRVQGSQPPSSDTRHHAARRTSFPYPALREGPCPPRRLVPPDHPTDRSGGCPGPACLPTNEQRHGHKSAGMTWQPRAAMPAVAAALVLLCLAPAWGLEVEMQTQTKCIYEEINANVLVVGDFKAFNKDNPSIPVYVDVRVGTRRPRRPPGWQAGVTRGRLTPPLGRRSRTRWA